MTEFLGSPAFEASDQKTQVGIGVYIVHFNHVVVVAVRTSRCRRDLQPPGRGPEKQLPLGGPPRGS